MLNKIKERYEKNKFQVLPLNNEQCKWLIDYAEMLESHREELRESYNVRIDKYIDLYEEAEKYKQALEDIRDITTGSAHVFAIRALEELR